MNLADLLGSYSDGRRDFRNVEFIGLDGHSSGPFERCNFAGAVFRAADANALSFRDCNFSDAQFVDSFLMSPTFERCSCDGLILRKCETNNIRVHDSSLVEADFWGSSLKHGEFIDCDVRAARFMAARFDDFLFRRVKFDRAVFRDAVLTRSVLDELCHAIDTQVSAVTVDWESVCRSIRSPHLVSFLKRTGMPEIFAVYMVDCARAVDPQTLHTLFSSTFISYGGPDAQFASKLRDALERNGVRTFLFARDAVPGQRLHQVMRDGVNQYDRVVLLCSRASLNRPGVLNEIEETLAREARDGGVSYLLPVTLDDYIFEFSGALGDAIRARVIADFRGADGDDEKFFDALRRLLTALRVSRGTG